MTFIIFISLALSLSLVETVNGSASASLDRSKSIKEEENRVHQLYSVQALDEEDGEECLLHPRLFFLTC